MGVQRGWPVASYWLCREMTHETWNIWHMTWNKGSWTWCEHFSVLLQHARITAVHIWPMTEWVDDKWKPVWSLYMGEVSWANTCWSSEVTWNEQLLSLLLLVKQDDFGAFRVKWTWHMSSAKGFLSEDIQSYWGRQIPFQGPPSDTLNHHHHVRS